MFRSSVSRLVVAIAFVFALVLSTVPVQALPLDSGSQITLDGSWLAAALSWFEGLFAGGDGPETLQTLETGGSFGLPSGGGNAGTMSSSCIDPWGRPTPCPEYP